MKLDSLYALSPLDGRYRSEVLSLAGFFSEAALMRYRIEIEARYLMALSEQPNIPEVRSLTAAERQLLQALSEDFSPRAAERIKSIEQTTKHDVKAVEYYIKDKVKRTSLRRVVEFVHFGLTSEDVNNLAYSLMLRDSLHQVYIPLVQQLIKELKQRARQYKNIAILSLTHGQAATPTTLGKELAVFAMRLQRQLATLRSIKLLGKFSGATGNWAALAVAYPKVNWLAFSRRLVERLGLEFNPLTTQIESHDRLAETYQAISRLNVIVRNLDQDMWFYISRGIFGQANIAGEVGSSAMPHKINPIWFENSEGNCGLANALLHHLAEKLPLSRLQRDLTDSTVLRNQGQAVAYSVLAMKNTIKGLTRVQANKIQASAELNEHWEVLTEAVQTVMRRLGKPTPYEQLKSLTRGQQLDKVTLHCFIDSLALPAADQAALKKLTPASYIGLSSTLAKLT